MDLKQIYEARRSINFFDSTKELENQKLKEIIDLAVLAPSAFNLQPWRIIVVQSQEAKQKLHALSNNQPKVLDAPVTLIIVGDRTGYEAKNPAWKNFGDTNTVKGYQDAAFVLYGSTEERKIKFSESNAGLLAMSIMYAAKYCGVDSHPMSGIDFQGIKEQFELNDYEDVVMLIALGYFDSKNSLYPRIERRGYEEIVTLI